MPAVPKLSSNTIVVVATRETFSEIVRMLLESAGYKTFAASSVERLREIIEQGMTPDLIIEDLDATGVYQDSGRPVSWVDDVVRSRAPDIGRIFITSGPIPARHIRPTIFEKPFDADVLLQTVSALLSNIDLLYRSTSSSLANAEINLELVTVSDELLRYLAHHPEALREIHWRKFEEVVACLLDRSGFSASVQAGTRDHGIDVIAVQRQPFGAQLILLVQCKQQKGKVGVNVVRELYGVTAQRDATMALLATTSEFTTGACEFQRSVAARLALSDFDKLASWLLDSFGRNHTLEKK
jgi:restriction endonuclease Mrr